MSSYIWSCRLVITRDIGRKNINWTAQYMGNMVSGVVLIFSAFYIDSNGSGNVSSSAVLLNICFVLSLLVLSTLLHNDRIKHITWDWEAFPVGLRSVCASYNKKHGPGLTNYIAISLQHEYIPELSTLKQDRAIPMFFSLWNAVLIPFWLTFNDAMKKTLFSATWAVVHRWMSDSIRLSPSSHEKSKLVDLNHSQRIKSLGKSFDSKS